MDMKIQYTRPLLLIKAMILQSLSIFSSVFSVFVPFWKSLNLAQRCYVAATLLAFCVMFFGIQSILLKLVIGAMVTTAILYEFWPRFMTIWDSLPGKACILFVYAVIANFALASASGLVNSVTGVSAASLPYSHNFAIILMLPSWFFITTILALVLTQLLMPLYLLVLLLLKPFGIHGFWHAPNYRFVVTTAFVRYIWMLVVLVTVLDVSMEAGVVTFLKDTQPEVASNFSEEWRGVNVEVKPDPNAKAANLEPVASKLARADDERVATFDLGAQGDEFRLAQKQLLALFIFKYEADEFSRCASPEDTRVVELNDYEILTISPVEDDEIGYTYTVIPCRSAAIGNGVTP
ncbi:hypothetical protein Q4561_17570 [Alteromonas sp. 1_MG-2023]|uniref:hypothetical protein n=1 Tax=Alteromonas sp. 1_MG-2023 TaxID=3062669 RepID=UPI0026E29137|nr:hypothetical protein [Alteromonas sp. 1_MG-2023]MDO6568886.1 hypothetical protein [Alteromonas sp. 1_MG-2023]